MYQFIQKKQNQLDSLGRLPKGAKYKKKDARKLTQKLRGMDETALTDGKRLFNQNPFELIDRYATGRQRAMGRANQLQTLIAQTAQMGKVADSHCKPLVIVMRLMICGSHWAASAWCRTMMPVPML